MKKYLSFFVIIIIFAAVTTSNPKSAEASHNSNNIYKKIEKLDDDPVEKIALPIMYGVSVENLQDTFGDSRSGGRTHEGIDIFAARGTIIATPTEAVVTKTADKGLGGVQVWTANPGGESYYYAHMNAIWPDLKVGDELEKGDPIGFVGDTGNALGTSPHLHLGIYSKDREVINPYERITKTFTIDTIIDALKDYVEILRDELKKRS